MKKSHFRQKGATFRSTLFEKAAGTLFLACHTKRGDHWVVPYEKGGATRSSPIVPQAKTERRNFLGEKG